jgi:general secretion pathway protein G
MRAAPGINMFTRPHGKRSSRGFTLLELITTATVLLILASAVVPMVKNGVRREHEIELRQSLREMRTSIDSYKQMVDQQKIKAPPPENNGYPATLDELVEGVPLVGKTGKIRFLRRIPVDPMTGDRDWGLRSVQDDPESTSWGGGSVFDVYSKSKGVGMNGVPYTEW